MEFEEGTIIKGKELKNYMLLKVLPENMVMQGFQYRVGMNEYRGSSALDKSLETGFRFYFAKDFCRYLSDGTELTLVKIPNDEDVYVGRDWLLSHRLVIEKTFHLNEILSSPQSLETLILNGADITVKHDYAVGWAAGNGHLEAVKCLHGYGSDITAGNNDAVKWAAGNGHLEVVKYLHENGADITAEDNAAVQWAALEGHLEVVKYLYEQGADIRADNDYALKQAAGNGHLEVVKYLHKNGADITAGNNAAVRWASCSGHLEVVKYLHENGANLTSS